MVMRSGYGGVQGAAFQWAFSAEVWTHGRMDKPVLKLVPISTSANRNVIRDTALACFSLLAFLFILFFPVFFRRQNTSKTTERFGTGASSVRRHAQREGEESHDERTTNSLWKDTRKAGELSKEGADTDGGQMAGAKALM